jgi:hypothetical protein
MFENTEGAIKNGQSRETGNIGFTRRRQTKQKHNTLCVGNHYTQINTNNLNKTWALLQTTGGKRQTKYCFYAEIVTDITIRNSERKDE